MPEEVLLAAIVAKPAEGGGAIPLRSLRRVRAAASSVALLPEARIEEMFAERASVRAPLRLKMTGFRSPSALAQLRPRSGLS